MSQRLTLWPYIIWTFLLPTWEMKVSGTSAPHKAVVWMLRRQAPSRGGTPAQDLSVDTDSPREPGSERLQPA